MFRVLLVLVVGAVGVLLGASLSVATGRGRAARILSVLADREHRPPGALWAPVRAFANSFGERIAGHGGFPMPMFRGDLPS